LVVGGRRGVAGSTVGVGSAGELGVAAPEPSAGAVLLGGGTAAVPVGVALGPEVAA
jgi:hypothetical protein